MTAFDDQLQRLRDLRMELEFSSDALRAHARLRGEKGAMTLQIAAKHVDRAIAEISSRIDALGGGE